MTVLSDYKQMPLIYIFNNIIYNIYIYIFFFKLKLEHPLLEPGLISFQF